jgi:hypothetical protein
MVAANPSPAPDFSWDVAHPVVGAVINFTIDGSIGNIRALTWDFNDGHMASSAFNLSTQHMYSATSPAYKVKLWAMDRNFKISSREKDVEVGVGPSVDINEQVKSHGVVDFDFKISGGNEPYNVHINWNETGVPLKDYSLNRTDQPSGVSYADDVWTIRHTYTTLGTRFNVSIIGVDNTGELGVPFSNFKSIMLS